MLKKVLFLCIFVLALVVPTFANDFLDYVPSNTGLVIQCNLKQLVIIPQVREGLENIVAQNAQGYLEQIKDIGFDPLRDIEYLMMFVPANMDSKQNPNTQSIAFIAKGRFEISKLVESLGSNADMQNEVVLSVENGLQTITFVKNEGKAKMVFVDGNTVVIGTENGVNDAILVKFGKKAGVKSQKVWVDAISKLDSNDTFSASAIITDEARASYAKNEQTKALNTLQYLNVETFINNGFAINISGGFGKGTDMKEVMKSLDSLEGMIKSQASSSEIMADFAKNFAKSSNDLTVSIVSFVSKASLDKFFESK